MSSFATYMLGFFVLVIGLALGAHQLGVPDIWIIIGVIVALGLGILMATSRTKQRDPAPTNPPPRPGNGEQPPRTPGQF